MRHVRSIHPEDSFAQCVLVISENSNLEPLPVKEVVADLPPKQCQPQTIQNSSVIKCIGNVQPVIIPESSTVCCSDLPNSSDKKYNPIEMYKKILIGIEEETGEETLVLPNIPKICSDEQQEKQCSNTPQNSNLTHWRKNIKNNSFQNF